MKKIKSALTLLLLCTSLLNFSQTRIPEKKIKKIPIPGKATNIDSGSLHPQHTNIITILLQKQ